MKLRLLGRIRRRSETRHFHRRDTGSEQAAGVEEVQAVHRSDDHGAVHDVEVQFVTDDPAIPAVDELDGSVHRSGLEESEIRHGVGEVHTGRGWQTYLTYIRRELRADPTNISFMLWSNVNRPDAGSSSRPSKGLSYKNRQRNSIANPI